MDECRVYILPDRKYENTGLESLPVKYRYNKISMKNFQITEKKKNNNSEKKKTNKKTILFLFYLLIVLIIIQQLCMRYICRMFH